MREDWADSDKALLSKLYSSLTFDDRTHFVNGLSCLFETFLDGFGKCGSYDQAKSDSHVKNPIHLFRLDISLALEELENGGDRPIFACDFGIEIGGEGAVEVSDDATACDVGHRGDNLFDAVLSKDGNDWFGVDPRRCQNDLAERFIGFKLRVAV